MPEPSSLRSDDSDMEPCSLDPPLLCEKSHAAATSSGNNSATHCHTKLETKVAHVASFLQQRKAKKQEHNTVPLSFCMQYQLDSFNVG